MSYEIDDKLCEFYGIMVGDGCISKYKYRNKMHYEIRIDGNSLTDLHYYRTNLKKLVKDLFNRDPKIYHRKDCNGIALRFLSKELALFFNEKLGFPFGKKGQIKLNSSLLKNWKKTQAVLRGLFDTDGSLYFTKNDYNKRRCYPIIEIVSISKPLINQLKNILTFKGFVVTIGHNGQSVKLHGKKNLKAWFNSVSTSHIDKMSKFLFWQKYGICPTVNELPLAERLKKLSYTVP